MQGLMTWPMMVMVMFGSKEYCMHIGPSWVQSRTPSHCCLVRWSDGQTSNSVLLGLWWAPSLGLFSIGKPLPSSKSLASCRYQSFALDLYKVEPRKDVKLHRRFLGKYSGESLATIVHLPLWSLYQVIRVSWVKLLQTILAS